MGVINKLSISRWISERYDKWV